MILICSSYVKTYNTVDWLVIITWAGPGLYTEIINHEDIHLAVNDSSNDRESGYFRSLKKIFLIMVLNCSTFIQKYNNWMVYPVVTRQEIYLYSTKGKTTRIVLCDIVNDYVT